MAGEVVDFEGLFGGIIAIGKLKISFAVLMFNG